MLSSHFLFTYADRLDLEFHRAALRELHRVARREVRVFPLLEQGGRPVPALLSDATGFAWFWTFLGTIAAIFGLIGVWMVRTQKDKDA